jgi:hypothetical protein
VSVAAIAAAAAAAAGCTCREVAKAGHQLAEGWTVRLSNKQATGYYRSKTYIEPGGTGMGVMLQ